MYLTGCLVFLIGLIGFIINPKSLIQLILSIELLIIGASQISLESSFRIDDLEGQLYTIYIITLAGAESAIALAIVVGFYRLRGTIETVF